MATAGGRARVEAYGFVILMNKLVGKSAAQNIAVDCVFKPFVCGNFCVIGSRAGLGYYQALINLT